MVFTLCYVCYFLIYINMEKEEKKLLESVFTKFSPMSYPGRIYGMYVWDWNENKWVIDKKFCKENGIVIEK